VTSLDRLVPAGAGREIRLGPTRALVKADELSGHQLVGVFESTMLPGGGFPFAHVHDRYEEIFYVLAGEIEYRLGDEWHVAAAGTTVSVPPGTVHCFRNTSGDPARHLVVHAPATALRMIEDLAHAPREQWDAILAEHHSRLVG
jgi:uncharacterized cupin superfamily protein